jgi:predicted transcriptional regulator
VTTTTLTDTVIEHNGHVIKSQMQQECVRLLKKRPFKGYTAQEIEIAKGLDHGKVSGALSLLHQKGIVALLQEKRAGFMIYVLAENVKGRPTKTRKS